MNREILFRAKGSGNWRYGSYVHFDKKPINDCCNNKYKDFIVTNGVYGEHYYPITELSSLGQYTELKDKEGNKIFEGDIVHLKGDGYDGSKVGKDYYRVVTFHEGSFCLSIEDGVHYPVHTPIYDHCDSHSIVNWVVIGNVTDTPKLMK